MKKRKPGEEDTVPVRIPRSLHRNLKVAAALNGISLSRLVEAQLREHLKAVDQSALDAAKKFGIC